MKFIGPQWQTQASGGSSSVSSYGCKIVYSKNRPNDLQNGLWIKNDRELPLVDVFDWQPYKIDDYILNYEILGSSSLGTNYPVSTNYCFQINSSTIIEFKSSEINAYNISDINNVVKTTIKSLPFTNGIQGNNSTIVYYNNNFYIFGYSGVGSSGNFYKYNYSTNTITNILTDSHYSGIVTKLYSNKIILIGGYYTSTSSSVTYYYSNSYFVRIFDPSSNTITNLTCSTDQTYGSSNASYTHFSSHNPLAHINGDYLYMWGGVCYESSRYSRVCCLLRIVDLKNNLKVSTKEVSNDLISYGNYYFNINNKTYYYRNCHVYEFDINNENDDYLRLMNYQHYNIERDGISLYDSIKSYSNSSSIYNYTNYYRFIPSITNVSTIHGFTYLYPDYTINGDSSQKLVHYTLSINNSQEKPILVYPIKNIYPNANNTSSIILNNFDGNFGINAYTRVTDTSYLGYDSIENIYRGIYKIYKPDLSGEEQEAWKVINGVWTLINGSKPTHSFNNHTVVPDMTCVPGKSTVYINSDLNTGPYRNNSTDILKYIPPAGGSYQNKAIYCTGGNATSNFLGQPFTNTHSNLTMGYLYIRADKLYLFDDSIEFTNWYANYLYVNCVTLNFGFKDYIVRYQSIQNQYEYITAAIYANVKYIVVRLTNDNDGKNNFSYQFSVDLL